MTITEAVKESECCCSCRHNVRKQDEKQAGIYCECEIDGHYINYIACFESVCDMYLNECPFCGLQLIETYNFEKTYIYCPKCGKKIINNEVEDGNDKE